MLKVIEKTIREQAMLKGGEHLLIAASGLLVLALGWGGVRFPWRSAPILGLLAASALAWSLFGWRTVRAKEPLIPLRILRLRIVRDAILSSSFGLGGFVGLSVVMPIYYEICGGMNASDSGLTLIPLMVGTVAGATASGRLMSHVTHYKATPLLGLGAGLLTALAAAAMMSAGVSRSLLSLNALLTVTTFGIGAMLPIATVSVQNAVDPRDLGTAQATRNVDPDTLGAQAHGRLHGALHGTAKCFQFIGGDRLWPGLHGWLQG